MEGEEMGVSSHSEENNEIETKVSTVVVEENEDNNLVEDDEEEEIKDEQPSLENKEEKEEKENTSRPILNVEEEQEYLRYQEKIKEEERAAAKLKAKLILQESKYTYAGQSLNNSPQKTQKRESLNIDSLLRLFKSDFFDSWLNINYLYRYTSDGVHDYLCNQLYTMPDVDVEFFLIDLCTMLVHSRFTSTALEKFILDKCKKSVHFALQINWLFYSSMIGDTPVAHCSEELQSKSEIAVVNGNLAQTQLSSLLVADHCNETASNLSRMQSMGTLHSYSPTSPRGSNSSEESNSEDDEIVSAVPSTNIIIPSATERDDEDIHNEALEKLDRCDYFYQVLHFVEGLGQISDKLRSVPVPGRQKALVREMKAMNENLHYGIYLPLWEADAPHYCIVRLAADDVIVLKSRERVPFILLFEAVHCEENSSSTTIHKVAKQWNEKISKMKLDMKKNDEKIDSSVNEKQENIKEEKSLKTAAKPLPASDSVEDYSNSPFGEPFAKKAERIRNASPFGHLDGWHLRSVIIKYGDDCKQEYMALQLISQFKKIFTDANLPLFVRPYRILVNSPDSGIIETITDAISIDGLKKFYSTEERVTLKEHFLRYYVDPESYTFKLAVRNFVESLAGYSLVAYLLQIKDRHNGNILIDSDGHLIHIDFGFILTTSPGNINAENVPFKFTQEYMELMGGPQGSMFSYFTGLLRCGYLELRKHSEKIISLVEIMSMDTTLPCFANVSINAAEALKERFNLGMTEKQVDEFLSNMVDQAYDSWRTRYYDRFQYMTNNILY